MARSILVAMDDSPLGRRALAYALETFPDAHLVAAHVAYLEYDMLPTDTPEVYEAAVDELDEVGDETAQRVFEAIKEMADDGAVTVSFLTGEPEERLVEYVDSAGFDGVVMGTHGRDGVARLFIGSVAEAVVRKTDVPTTLVK
ncbi:universal stress protein [Halorubrum vacuolatum]|uniref:Nucleotide-binding universal stress protein, UspA family n=1 Tax=Halorubrum vacuolatum TaxID=63740 RepID=A0A238VEG8_HALVU|nr:universal stress protein [Halorubrum vacuolatum]SNR32646.1 Nucleotide-binding universal stress protein, UspA family [Halorubrum vacuolatum]